MTDDKTLGSCCICETRAGVVNVIMLDQRGTVPGRGWGCVVCDLPSDGAVAVLCDDCRDAWFADKAELRFVCRGYASSGERDPIEALPPGEFKHDEAKHTED